MRMEFEVELPDAPGELGNVLARVAQFGGNVNSVVHRHETLTDGRVAVVFQVDIPEDGALRLVDALARTHRLLRVNREGGPVGSVVLLVGHVFESGLTDLLDAVFEADAEVVELDVRIAGRSNPSAVLVRLGAPDAGAMGRGLEALRQRAATQGLMLLEPVGGEAGG